MSAIKILTETDTTVTVSRADWTELLAALDDAEDRASVAERRAIERSAGKKTFRLKYLTSTKAKRLLDGENPVKVWREKRGLSQRALAREAGIGHSYLAEIETGRKPGSDAAYRQLLRTISTIGGGRTAHGVRRTSWWRWRPSRPGHARVQRRIARFPTDYARQPRRRAYSSK